MKFLTWLFHCICVAWRSLQATIIEIATYDTHDALSALKWSLPFVAGIKWINMILIKSWYYNSSLFFFFKCLVLRQLWSYSSKKLQENILYLISSLNQKLLWVKLNWTGLKWLLQLPVICCSFCILLLESLVTSLNCPYSIYSTHIITFSFLSQCWGSNPG